MNTLSIKKALTNKRLIAFLIFAIVAFLISFFLIREHKSFADERFHYRQVKLFIDNRLEITHKLTTIPGYHLVVALIMKLFHTERFFAMRLISLSFSLATIPLFFSISKKISKDEEHSLIRTLQYVSFPIIFPFFFLAYTDIFSVLIILLSFYFLLGKKYTLSGIFAIFSFCVRQNNIVWMLFNWIYIYISTFGFKVNKENLLKFIKETWAYVIGMISFAAFLFFNGGIAIKDKENQHAGFYLGNIYFILFLFLAFFIPLHAHNIKKMLNYFKTRILYLILVLSLFIISFIFIKQPLHPYNHGSDFLRNIIILYFNSNFQANILYFILVLFAALSLIVTKLKISYFWILYPATFLFLVPSQLIEQRYYIIPFTLFLIFSQKIDKKYEIATVIINSIMAILLFKMILAGNLFI